MNQTEDNDGLGFLIILGLGIGVWIVVSTWPVSLILLISAGGWWLSRTQQSPWGKATKRFLFSVTLGLSALTILLFSLNVFRYFDPAAIRNIEETLIRWRINIRGLTNLPLPTFVIIVAILIAVGYFYPRLKLITHFLRIQKVLSSIAISLVAFTSFTFFSQVPMEELANNAHKEAIERYQVLLRSEWNSVGQYVATQTLNNAARNLDSTDRNRFQAMFKAIQTHASNVQIKPNEKFYPLETPTSKSYLANLSKYMQRRDLRLLVAERFAAKQAGVAVVQENISSFATLLTKLEGPDVTLKLSSEISIEKVPTSATEWEGQLQLIIEQQERTRLAELKASEAFAGTKKIFSRLVGLGTPEFEGIVGTYIQKLVNSYAESFFDKAVEKWYRANPKSSEAKEIPKEMIQALVPKEALARDFLVIKMERVDYRGTSESMNFTRMVEEVNVETKRIVEREIEFQREAARIERQAEARRTEAMRERARGRARPRGR